uniref:Uncharacterized protein n=1 Tax=Aegilops tauschii subsp. strangulata TaxID=200361 RepID=A0A453RPZ9_AEGTS
MSTVTMAVVAGETPQSRGVYAARLLVLGPATTWLLGVLVALPFQTSSIVSTLHSPASTYRSTRCSRRAAAERMSSAPAPVFERLAGIRPLAESGRFKAWFLDQFGVLHDGKKPYPGAILALEKLAGNGAKMVIISNSSRRSSVTMEKLQSLGFDTSCFLGAITSGELTQQYLHKRDDPWFASLGRKCIHLTWGNRGAISLEGLGLQVVNNVDDAEFILAHGTEALGLPSGDPLSKSLEELEQILVLGIQKRLPMVVANPDYVTVEARNLRVMPGTLAAKYECLGGEVKWMGKPDKVIYTSAMSLAGVEAHECITVGDSLHHDIKGASGAGMTSAFITGGIHAAELGLGEFGETAGDDANPGGVQHTMLGSWLDGLIWRLKSSDSGRGNATYWLATL